MVADRAVLTRMRFGGTCGVHAARVACSEEYGCVRSCCFAYDGLWVWPRGTSLRGLCVGSAVGHLVRNRGGAEEVEQELHGVYEAGSVARGVYRGWIIWLRVDV